MKEGRKEGRKEGANLEEGSFDNGKEDENEERDQTNVIADIPSVVCLCQCTHS